MPRFLFLNAIAVARTDGQNAFVSELRDMVERYPDSELASMSKDMLALMGQGAESKKGDMSSLQNKRQTEVVEETVDSVTVEFDKERRAPSLVLLILEQDEKKLNQLLYEIALFNFTQFMIKDFDIRQVISFDAKRSAIQIAGFEKMDEAEWYCQLLAKNAELSQRIAEYQVQVIAITEGNMEIMSKHFTLEEYLEFCKPKVKGKSKT
jgi:hypothetical protein